MTEKHLSLVTSFSYPAYPYRIEAAFADPLDSLDRRNKRRAMDAGISLARIEDYHLFERHDLLELNLRSRNDFERASIAMGPDQVFSLEFAVAPEHYDFRKLKNRCNRLQRQLEKVKLNGEVYFDVDREARAILLFAENKRAYLAFRMLAERMPGVF